MKEDRTDLVNELVVPCPDNDELVWSLPGHGRTRETCGEIVYLAHRCKPIDSYEWHWKRGVRRCHRPSCPVCYESWAAREGQCAAKRIDAYAQRVGRPAIHLIVSPPPGVDTISKKSFRALRARAYAELKSHGIEGGLLIYHHLRVPGKWNERAGCAAGSHFHCVGFGWHRHFYRPGGWILKNKGIRKSVSGTISYLLSHCGLGYPASSQSTDAERLAVNTVTWFGALSYNKFKSNFAGNMIACPVCGEMSEERTWRYAIYIGKEGPPEALCGILTDDWLIDGAQRPSVDIWLKSLRKNQEMDLSR